MRNSGKVFNQIISKVEIDFRNYVKKYKIYIESMLYGIGRDILIVWLKAID